MTCQSMVVMMCQVGQVDIIYLVMVILMGQILMIEGFYLVIVRIYLFLVSQIFLSREF